MAGHVCAVCGKRIGGPDGRDNVAVVRWIRLQDGRSGWISMHVRCAGAPWPRIAEKGATPSPPGKPLQLQTLEVNDGV